MKKSIMLFILTTFLLPSSLANNFPPSMYKNLKLNDKISYDFVNEVWSDKLKNKDYFIKNKGFGDFYDYLYSNGEFAFSTNCEYEFIFNNSFFCYSNRDMKFYSIAYADGNLNKRELSKSEVQKLFPNYIVIALSEFSDSTHAYKIKKSFKNLKIILLNDTSKTFDGYLYTTGNANIETYCLRSFLNVKSPGMIEFEDEQSKNLKTPRFIILVR